MPKPSHISCKLKIMERPRPVNDISRKIENLRLFRCRHVELDPASAERILMLVRSMPPGSRPK